MPGVGRRKKRSACASSHGSRAASALSTSWPTVVSRRHPCRSRRHPCRALAADGFGRVSEGRTFDKNRVRGSSLAPFFRMIGRCGAAQRIRSSPARSPAQMPDPRTPDALESWAGTRIGRSSAGVARPPIIRKIGPRNQPIGPQNRPIGQASGPAMGPGSDLGAAHQAASEPHAILAPAVPRRGRIAV